MVDRRGRVCTGRCQGWGRWSRWKPKCYSDCINGDAASFGIGLKSLVARMLFANVGGAALGPLVQAAVCAGGAAKSASKNGAFRVATLDELVAQVAESGDGLVGAKLGRPLNFE